MKTTTNLGLKKIELSDSPPDITVQDANWDLIDKQLYNAVKFQKAGGTGTAIALPDVTLTDGFCKTFIATSNNNGVATTINGKPLYKPGGTSAPKLIAGKAVTVWYDVTGDCFFIKASAEGDAVAGNVLAGKTFSNDDDTGLTGTMVNKSGVGTSSTWTNTNKDTSVEVAIPANGYYDTTSWVTANDPDLVSSNIKAGVNLFGVDGSFTADATATDPNVLSGKTYYRNAVKGTGTMPDKTFTATGNTYTSADGYKADAGTHIYIRPKEGYYKSEVDADGFGPVSIQDLNFTSANIPAFKTIFGKQGTFMPRIPNLLKNGNFASQNCWDINSAVINSITGNVLKFTPNAQYGRILQTGPKLSANHKYYCRIEVNGLDDCYLRIYWNNADTNPGYSNHSSTLQWETLGFVITPDADGDIQSLIAVQSRATSGWSQIMVRNAVFIDMTAEFGSGKELSGADMEALITAAGWWDSRLSKLIQDTTTSAGSVTNGHVFYDGNGIRQVGTIPDINTLNQAVAMSSSPGRVKLQPPTGYHHGWDTYYDDINLVPANWPTTKTILGQQGTMPDRNSSNQIATAVTNDVGRIYLKPPVGYYNGNIWLQYDDPGFITANIVKNKTIFGLSGTAPVVITGSATISSDTKNFYNAQGNTMSWHYITVTGLTFKPSHIFFLLHTGYWLYTGHWMDANVMPGVPNSWYTEGAACIVDGSLTNGYALRDGAISVTSTGFTIPAPNAPGYACYWFTV